MDKLAREARGGNRWAAFCWLRRCRPTPSTIEDAVIKLFPDALVTALAFDALVDARALMADEISDAQARAYCEEHYC